MPDVFVAPEEKKEVIMHQRTPLPSSSRSQSTPTEKVNAPTTTPEQHVSPPNTPSTYQSFSQAPDITTRGGIPLFTSFWQNPRGVYFDTQEANEHILLFLRQHFITNVPWIFLTIVMLLLPPVGSFVLMFAHVTITLLPISFLAAAIGFYYLIVLTHAFTHFLEWFFNISLITPRRVLDIEHKDLVYKKISATKMSLVQDITYQQSGTIRTIFNYGDVLIQTASATDNFYINAAPKPETVVKIVEQLIGKDKEDREYAEH